MDNGEKSGSNIKEIPAIIQGRYKKKQMANGRGKEEGERAKGKGERKPVKSKRRLPSDAEIRKAIIEARRHTFNAEALEDEAQYFSSLYNHLLDFANTPNYPDHIIEKKNILRYYFQLEYQLGGYAAKPEQIATYMKRDWGEDWEEKLDNEKRRLG